MSLFSIFTAGLACVSLASAYTQPTGDAPEGNPISQPGLSSIVPAGEAFSVTWQPTTKGTVSLVLLKGPSSDAEPQYAIAEKVPNNGLFVWTPSTDLAPTTDATGYGIQLIDDATGQYQYTTQFGISNDNYVASSSSASSAVVTATSSWSGPVHSGPPGHGSWSDSWPSASWTTSVSGAPKAANSTVPSAPFVTAPTTALPSSGMPKNVTMVAPTGSMTVPSSLLTSATSTSASATSASGSAKPTSSSGAAANMKASFAGLVFAGAVAVFAL